jgi:hypothetical protein
VVTHRNLVLAAFSRHSEAHAEARSGRQSIDSRRIQVLSVAVCANCVWTARFGFCGAPASLGGALGHARRRWRNVGRAWRYGRRLLWLSASASEANAGGRHLSSELSNEIAHGDSQRVGDDLKRIERHALAAILQPVKMNAIQASEFGKLILRDSLLQAQPPDAFPNSPVDILQPIRLRVYAALKHPA